MNGSPAICSEKRVQRAHSTQRSRSSSTWAEMLIGLGKVRLTPPVSANRLSPRPLLIAWFCRGHSPPLSQTGQSSGWLISRNSMIALLGLVGHLARRLGVDDHALGDRQRAGGLRLGEAATVAGVGDVDQALAAGADRLEERVVAEARDRDADLLGGPDHQGVLGDADLHPVDRQRDGLDPVVVFSGVVVMRRLPRVRSSRRTRSRRPGRTGSRHGSGGRGTRRGST